MARGRARHHGQSSLRPTTKKASRRIRAGTASNSPEARAPVATGARRSAAGDLDRQSRRRHQVRGPLVRASEQVSSRHVSCSLRAAPPSDGPVEISPPLPPDPPTPPSRRSAGAWKAAPPTPTRTLPHPLENASRFPQPSGYGDDINPPVTCGGEAIRCTGLIVAGQRRVNHSC